ncbi:MAG: MBOAT family protein [Lachnospiraceae bacterium]|nr:MBOAT family protein [Lachnospiraceae bacterium]
MLFNSLSFLIFFPIVVLLYFVIPPKVRYIWLLLASYFFYMGWNAKYALLLLFSTVVTYGAGLLLYKWREKPGRKKTVVAVGLVVNFGILFLFKYLDFVIDTIQSLVAKVGITIAEPSFNLLLPVGISFYIFQAVGYMVDIYREKLAPEKNFLKYALFVSYFPQLVAGPIERSTRLLPQLKNLDKIKVWNLERIRSGALVMLYGYFLKMVIADRAALLVDTVFHANYYSQYVGFTALVGAILFSVQIYCDFAGYTYIAIGASKILGVELMNNFNTPYLATSVKDFWDRWHISLTSWFRDYLYFPLGGSRKGKLRKYVNIMIVFSVSGLWHGAAWHYVVWGMLHGGLRVAEEITEKLRTKVTNLLQINTAVLSYKAFRVCVTFFLVTIAWVFFRAESIGQALDLIKNMLTVWNPWVLFDDSLLCLGLDGKDWNVLLFALLVMFVTECFQYKKVSLSGKFAEQNLIFQWGFFLVGILFIMVFGIYGPAYSAAQFIYFQF